MNTTEPIEAKPIGSSNVIWRLWQEGTLVADCLLQDEAEHLARLHNQSLRGNPGTFQAHGLTWIKHVPGDPMPCDGRVKVRVIFKEFTGDKEQDCDCTGDTASGWFWGKKGNHLSPIAGWNYADAP